MESNANIGSEPSACKRPAHLAAHFFRYFLTVWYNGIGSSNLCTVNPQTKGSSSAGTITEVAISLCSSQPSTRERFLPSGPGRHPTLAGCVSAQASVAGFHIAHGVYPGKAAQQGVDGKGPACKAR